MSYQNNMCLICNVPLEVVPAGTNKEGKSFKSFMGCPNYKKHPKKVTQPTGKDGVTILADEVMEFRKEMNKRMNNMAKYLVEKLGQPKGEIDVKNLEL